MGRRRDLEAAIVKHEVEQHGLVAVRQARALRISEGALQRQSIASVTGGSLAVCS